jgi:hypothetical protein
MKSSQPSSGRTRLCVWLASVSLATACGLQAETADTITRKFAASPGGRLVVDIDAGGIEVRGTDANEVAIEYVRKVSASSKEKEEEFLREQEVTIEQQGDTVTLRARRKVSDEGWGWLKRGWSGLRTEFRCIISIPRRFNVDLRTSGGGIDVASLQGDLRANTSGGGLHFEQITGPIDGHTSGGGIKLIGCSGDVKVHTSGGGIESRDGKGPLELNTSGGGITVRTHEGDVRAHTSGGGITAESIQGNVNAGTSGGSIRATLVAQPSGECRLNTSGGGITIGLPENAAVELDASTSAGSVSSDFAVTVTGEHKKSHLQGPINGGGPLLHLRSSAGSIRVQRVAAVAPAATAVER